MLLDLFEFVLGLEVDDNFLNLKIRMRFKYWSIFQYALFSLGIISITNKRRPAVVSHPYQIVSEKFGFLLLFKNVFN